MLVGLHAVFQPLCYFRIKEFRRFANKAFGRPCRTQAPFLADGSTLPVIPSCFTLAPGIQSAIVGPDASQLSFSGPVVAA